MRSMTDEVLVFAIEGSMLQFIKSDIRPSSGCSATTFSPKGEGPIPFISLNNRLRRRRAAFCGLRLGLRVVH